MRGTGLYGAAVAALIAGQPALAQDTGGLQLTFGISERLEASDNAALASPAAGRLTASTTSLSFGLSSETRTQVLRLNLAGALRLEEGDGAADPDLFGNPSLDAFYSLTGANSALVVQGSAQRQLLSQATPTATDPDPAGGGTRTSQNLSATLDLGTSGPLGLTLQASAGSTSFSDPAEDDSETTSASAVGHLRFGTGAEARLSVSQSSYSENDGAATRDTTGAALGWVQPLSPVLTLDAGIGADRVETTTTTDDGITGHLALEAALANGSAGLRLEQVQDVGGARQNLTASRSLDLGNQTLALTLGATRQDGTGADPMGTLSWAYESPALNLSLDLGRSIAPGEIAGQVTTDRLALGLSRDLSPRDRIGLTLSATRIDDTTAALVERRDISASYSRDLGQDWAMSLGATYTDRSEGAAEAQSSLLFLEISRSFAFRP